MSEIPQSNPDQEKGLNDLNAWLNSGETSEEAEARYDHKPVVIAEDDYEPSPNELEGKDLEEREHGKKHEMY